MCDEIVRPFLNFNCAKVSNFISHFTACLITILFYIQRMKMVRSQIDEVGMIYLRKQRNQNDRIPKWYAYDERILQFYLMCLSTWHCRQWHTFTFNMNITYSISFLSNSAEMHFNYDWIYDIYIYIYIYYIYIYKEIGKKSWLHLFWNHNFQDITIFQYCLGVTWDLNTWQSLSISLHV